MKEENIRRGAVLISGAAGGIGGAAVRALAMEGYLVFAGVLNAQEAAQLEQEKLSNVLPVPLDVADVHSIASALVAMSQAMPHSVELVGLIHAAGLNYNAPLQYLSVDEIKRMVDVNLTGSILLTRAALPLLRPHRSRIIFIGSATGLVASPIVSAYAATKFAIEGLSDSLRLELRSLGIQVSLIEPGIVRTPMTAGAPKILEIMLARMAAEDKARYQKAMQKISDLSSGPSSGIYPDKVASVICDILRSNRPKARYQIGMDSRVAAHLRHFPDSFRDFVQGKIFAL